MYVESLEVEVRILKAKPVINLLKYNYDYSSAYLRSTFETIFFPNGFNFCGFQI